MGFGMLQRAMAPALQLLALRFAELQIRAHQGRSPYAYQDMNSYQIKGDPDQEGTFPYLWRTQLMIIPQSGRIHI